MNGHEAAAKARAWTVAHTRAGRVRACPPPTYPGTALYRLSLALLLGSTLLLGVTLLLELGPQLLSLLEFRRVQAEILHPGDGSLELIDVCLPHGSRQTRKRCLFSLPKAAGMRSCEQKCKQRRKRKMQGT